MLARLKVLSQICAVLCLSAKANALPKVTVEKINGYEVHFVDIGKGDSFAVTFYLPVGTMHDSGENMGRAHLFEHIVHTGTQEFPGYHTLNETLSTYGALANAHTAPGHTFYHAAVPQFAAEPVMHSFLSMLGGLEWNPKTFVKERQVVINEIAGEKMKSEFGAIMQMVFTKLLPPGHPWAVPTLGSRASLGRMTQDQLKEFYYTNYRPEFIKVALHGNFSDPAYLAQVKQWAAKYLRTVSVADDPAGFTTQAQPLAKAPLPSIIPARGIPRKSLYLESSGARLADITFEGSPSPARVNSSALDLLVKYLNLKLKGTLNYTLAVEKNWASWIEFQPSELNNQLHLNAFVGFTELGFRHRDEIQTMLMQMLRSVQLHGVPPEILRLLKSDELDLWERNTRSVATSQEAFLTVLADATTLEKRILQTKRVTSADLQKIAGRFHSDRALFAAMGPKVPGMTFNRSYRRNYRLDDNRLAAGRYARVFSLPEVDNRFQPTDLRLEFKEPAPEPLQKFFVRTPLDKGHSQRITADFRSDLPDNSVQVTFRFPADYENGVTIIDLIRRAFTERFVNETELANLKYRVLPGITSSQNGLTIQTTGETRMTAVVAAWLLERLAEFEPTDEELERARLGALDDAFSQYTTEFSAQVAMSTLTSLLDPYEQSLVTKRKSLESIKVSDVASKWRRLKLGSLLEFVLIGDLRVSDFEAVSKAARQASPWTLDRPQFDAIFKRFSWIDKSEEITLPWTVKKDAIGLNRTYRGPKALNLRESAAFIAFNMGLASLVENHNRGEQKLGYIHTSTVRSIDGQSLYLTLYGQAESAELAGKTVTGWDYILDGLRTGRIGDQDIARGLADAINTYNQETVSAAELAPIYANQQNLRGDPKVRAKMVAELKSLTVDEIKAVAWKYVLGEDLPALQLKLQDCEAKLTKPGA